ncbi:50S ribosomal protein L17 [bacterium]|nr:50S ribosomal protein L17 [bacterium]
MRHRKAVNKLGRTASHRKALMANLAGALFEQKHIKTTEAKAKAARQFVERLITLARKDTTHARRLAYQRLRHKTYVKVLFEEIAPQYVERPGGYTRVIKLGKRQGDAADMAILELVGFETASKKKKAKEAKAAVDTDLKKKVKEESTPAEETTEK